LLSIVDLSYSYGAQPVLQDITLTIQPTTVVGILGPNGSGKTTLLRLLSGMLTPPSGRVEVNGVNLQNIPRSLLARQMAVVPQETHVAFDYSVLEIVLMGRYPHLQPFETEGPNDLAIARTALAQTGTAALADRSFMTLSGGEKQRVIIASALAQFGHSPVDVPVELAPEILLLDEPTASLDLGYQMEIGATLRQLNANRGITMIVSTHDLNFAASICQNVVLLRDGRILAAGELDTVLNPKNISRLYDVDASVDRHPLSGQLSIVPFRRQLPPSVASQYSSSKESM
jgi:iron complex transport system ATP-binding protein|tara:strand:+ start:555 stop:1415 length:861 start_codon:yes stop_codon:yes gene_type:complete